MWQRIQTLYLAVSTAIVAALFFSPLARAIGTDGQVAVIYFSDSHPYLYLMISILTAHAFALFLFKRRGVQLRVTVIAALLLAGFQIWLGAGYFTSDKGIVHSFTVLLPMVAAFFDILAIRGITADILMVESVSRLRTSRKNRKRK